MQNNRSIGGMLTDARLAAVRQLTDGRLFDQVRQREKHNQ